MPLPASIKLGAADLLRHRPRISLALAGLGGAILTNAVVQHDLGRALIYLAVIAVSVVLIDVTLARWPASARTVPVRNAGAEAALLIVSLALGLFWLTGRFVWNLRPEPGLLRLLWLAILVGCVFNALPAIVLLARRYRITDLGVRITGLQAVPLVIAAFAAATLALSPASITWRGAIEDTGSIGALIGTALLAAVPEEFFRFAWQTRVGVWLKNPAIGWLIASACWALLHAPKDWDESHSLPATVMGVVNIVPLGLLWGYLTHRTGSMLPAIALHATNLWGLQNLS